MTLTVICIDTYCKVTVCILVIMYACACVRGGINKNKKIEHTLTFVTSKQWRMDSGYVHPLKLPLSLTSYSFAFFSGDIYSSS